MVHHTQVAEYIVLKMVLFSSSFPDTELLVKNWNKI